ncbi:hypothetical protein CKCBHOJB_01875 [Thauera sp. GDN1]|uniref:hypothetical protein n=1 Tax=Thauera sp. GDN1 TaxID=2944810 RepID=UPI00247ADCB6|nr:hypothetical protein [Thauera sp. GDN1]WEN42288.1 hypothetical protein CKCBHOJB_01875 [Thauera sp. GDN1]
MYEIWLTLNILFELALQYLPAVVGTAVLWVALMGLAASRGNAGWGKALKPALVIFVVVTAITFFITPAMTKSSFANMGYWVDWGNLFLYAAGFGGVAAALVWPLAAMMRRAG